MSKKSRLFVLFFYHSNTQKLIGIRFSIILFFVFQFLHKGIVWIHPHRSEITEAAFPDLLTSGELLKQQDRLNVLPKLLSIWFNVSTQYNLTSWIEAGSLLAVSRDNGLIIPWYVCYYYHCYNYYYIFLKSKQKFIILFSLFS
jgi:hypothetical protein